MENEAEITEVVEINQTEATENVIEQVTVPVQTVGEVNLTAQEVLPATDNTQAEKAIEELTVQVEQLQTENTELKQQLADVQAELSVAKTTQETADAEVNTTKEKAENYEKALEKVVAERAEAVPDDVKALIPSGISVSEQLDWLVKAEKLTAKEQTVVSIGQPTPVTEKVVDQSELSVTQRLSNVFATTFNK